MKRIVCEMCGGTDLQKEDGVFVCQSCGCKYSVEEARKLMVEGPVDVTGSTVKVDSSDKLANLYTLARRAKSDNNTENAQNYYQQIAVEDPNSWEAAFYSVYYTAMNCTIGQIASAVISIDNCLTSTFQLIKEYTPEEKWKEEYSEVYTDAFGIGSTFISAALNHASKYMELESTKVELKQKTGAIFRMWTHIGDELYSQFNDKEAALEIYKSTVNTIKSAKNYSGLSVAEIDSIHDRITKLDPTYVKPATTVASGGCYVATAVYGSYDCPEVWTLRRYRDYDLAGTWYGRVFIRTYYAISPTIVKCFGNTEWFKRMWRGKLDRMVNDLQNKGYESTPYEDRNW